MKILLGNEHGWPGGELKQALETAGSLDLTVCHRDFILAEKHDLEEFDAILIFGPHTGSVMPLLRELARLRSKGTAPKLIWWVNENLPPFDAPVKNTALGKIRGIADRISPPPPRTAAPLKRKDLILHRYRILHELKTACKWGVLDCLAVTSGYRAKQLNLLGLPAIGLPMGYGPGTSLGEPLNLERDIDVLFLGSLGYGRARSRTDKLEFLKEALGARGITVKTISKGLVGDERTKTLNRTRILLNLVRSPEDWTGLRLLLGAANGAMNVSEPMVDVEPFVDGTHIAFALLEELPDVIQRYLENENERKQITDNAYALITGDQSMESCLKKLFNHVGIALTFHGTNT